MLDPNSYKIESYPLTYGGQHVGTWRGMKIHHHETGITLSIDVCRSQHGARQLLLSMLEDALTHPLLNKAV